MKKITFKVSDEEAQMLRSMAKAEQASLSEYLRRRAIGAARSVALPSRIRCEFTGAMIFDMIPELQPITTKTVHEMLGDFP